MKPKKCKTCKQPFTPFNSIQPTCGKYDCQVAFAENHARKLALKRGNAERKELREAKQRIKTRSQWLKEAQSEFNKYIRLRDKSLPCISCQRHHHGQYHAGHYRTVGAAPQLRFNEDNCHKQCAPCNNYLSGNIVAYRAALIIKIGRERVSSIETNNEKLNLTIDDIKAIKEKYRLLSRALLTKGD